MAEPTNAEIIRDLRMFGRNLCTARELVSPNQRVFAKAAGYDRSTISKIECGKQAPNFDTLLTLARAARVKPAELLDGVGPAPTSSDAPSHESMRPQTPAASFGANLKWARERAKLSHEKLGSSATADRSLIGPWETGDCEANLRTILKLARALDIPPAVLLHDVEADPLPDNSLAASAQRQPV
jgi:transcriptional regulator with XRE-family HTH domain